MPGPLLPIALLFAGMAANRAANRKVSDERSRLSRLQQIRDQESGQQADAVLRESLAAQERPAVEQNQRVAEASREQKYAAAAPASGSEFAATPSAPKEVKSEIAARMVDALRRGRQQSKALAKLGANSDASLDSQIGLGRSGQELTSIGNRSRASSAILPYELAGAESKGEGLRTIGDIFNLASFGTGLYGMSKPPVDYGGFYARSAANPTFSH